MTKSALSVSLIVIVLATVTEAGFLAPVASGYIYRNDNHGPTRLVQTATPYQQPQAFPNLLPFVQNIAQPLKLQGVEAYDLAPAISPLPNILPQPIKEDAEVHGPDKSDESSEEYLDGDDLNGDTGTKHVYEKESGADYNEEHHEARGEKDSNAYRSEENNQDGESGHYSDKHEKLSYRQNKEETDTIHDDRDTQEKHSNSAQMYKGSNHGYKKHFNKGEDVTGYHKVFHKDEFKKDHDFYDVADNSGHSKKYENSYKKHNSADGGGKKVAHHKSGYEKARVGKEGYHAQNQDDENEEDNFAEEGHGSQYSHEDDYSKKGSKFNEKEYRYDDDED